MKQAADAFTFRHSLLEPQDHILAAVSGGPDSIGLLAYLYERSLEIGFRLSVIHVHHHLRKEAEEDMRCAAEAADSNSLPFHVKHAAVEERRKAENMSTQQAARAERYDLFSAAMEEIQANKLATAHHGDDQAETLLMRFVRGSMQGQKGIPVRRGLGSGEVIRPFLSLSKTEIINFCIEKNLSYRIDQSNYQNTYQRNRLRNEVMPLLIQENPRLHEAAQWQAEMQAAEEEYLNAETEKQLAFLKKFPEKILFQQKEFQSIPSALQKRAVHLILNYLMPTAPWARHHIEKIMSICFSTHASQQTPIGYSVRAEKSYEEIMLTTEVSERHSPFSPFSLEKSGEYELRFGTLKMSGEPIDSANDTAVTLLLEEEQLPLQVRIRREGDRIASHAGTKKLKKLFIDAKIPRKLRDEWPIITDRHGTILWVPFLQQAKQVQTDNYKKQTIHLAFNQSKDILLFH